MILLNGTPIHLNDTTKKPYYILGAIKNKCSLCPSTWIANQNSKHSSKQGHDWKTNQNVAGENKTVTIAANTPILKGFSTTHIETNDQAVQLEKGKLNADLGHHRLHTFRLFLAKTSKE